jgi:SMC interacting uncharacterized protein involved in chromosome segregation
MEDTIVQVILTIAAQAVTLAVTVFTMLKILPLRVADKSAQATQSHAEAYISLLHSHSSQVDRSLDLSKRLQEMQVQLATMSGDLSTEKAERKRQDEIIDRYKEKIDRYETDIRRERQLRINTEKDRDVLLDKVGHLETRLKELEQFVEFLKGELKKAGRDEPPASQEQPIDMKASTEELKPHD